jgi:hypothetical protein
MTKKSVSLWSRMRFRAYRTIKVSSKALLENDCRRRRCREIMALKRDIEELARSTMPCGTGTRPKQSSAYVHSGPTNFSRRFPVVLFGVTAAPSTLELK